MDALKQFHMALAYLTVVGFVVRGLWSIMGSPLGEERAVKIAPHVVDTLLLSLGVAMAVGAGISPLSGWLAAKLVGLLGYIGFGVLTMRARTTPIKVIGFVSALTCVGYIFAVAFTRSPWPL